MGFQGIIADVVASGAFTGVASMVSKTPVGMGVAIAGGAVGGVVGQYVDDGSFSLERTATAAFAGALGGAAGGLGAKALGKFLGGKVDDAGKKINDLGSPDDLKRAERAVTEADEAIDRAQTKLDRHLADGPNKTWGRPSAKDRREFKEKKEQLEDEVENLKGVRNGAVRDRDELSNKAGSSDEIKKAEAGKKRLEKWKDSPIPFVSLVSLGSALGLALWGGLFDSDGSRDSSGETGDETAGETSVELTWAGQEAANAAGLMGKAPFVRSPTPAAVGNGFLLHPVELDPSLAMWYAGVSNSFASSLAENYKMFGDLEKKEDLSVTPLRPVTVSSSVSEGSDGGAGYGQAAQALNASAEALNQKQADLAGTLQQIEEVTKTGQENIGNLIAGVNGMMGSFPVDGGIDANFLDLLNQAVSESTGIMEDARASAELAARTVGDPDQRTNPSAQDLGNAVQRFNNGLDNPALTPNIPPSPPDLEQLIPDEPDLEPVTPPELDPAADRLGQVGDMATPGIGGAGAPGAAGMDPSGGMMNSMMSSMLPMMMQQAMMRNSADNDLAARRADIDPSRYEQNPAMTAPPPAAPPAHTTPWSGKQAGATPAAAAPQQPAPPHGGPGPGVTSSQAGGTPPRTPGEDGSIVYTFPDGRTQKVSPTVAGVLDKVFANIKGTDAQEAYADTEAKWTDQKQIGQRADPFQLMTGDVATWDDRTAVAVVFGAGEEGTLEVVVNGELQEFSPEMSDSAGEFGQFTGFAHPPGIELGDSKDKAGDSGTTSGDQQSATPAGDAPLAVAPA